MEWKSRSILVLLILSIQPVLTSGQTQPTVLDKELEGAYIGTRGSEPIWLRIERPVKDREGCTFQYTIFEPTRIVMGKGTATRSNQTVKLGDLKGIIQRNQALPKHPVILTQTIKDRPVWRVQKIDDAAASRLADYGITTILTLRRKLLETGLPAEVNGPVADETLKLLDAYIAGKIPPVPSRMRLIQPPEPQVDTAMIVELEKTKNDLAVANEQLENCNKRLTAETERYGAEEGKLKRLEAEARTAYYTIMPYDDMVRAGLISRDGMFGSVARLRDYRLDSFIKIDLEESRELSLPYRIHRLQILTPHPSSSYQLIPVSGERTLLRITDREAFWRGHFLVIGVR